MFDAFASQDQHLNGRQEVREVCMCTTGINVVLENPNRRCCVAFTTRGCPGGLETLSPCCRVLVQIATDR